ncbi:DUF572-domain-containing protein [Coemansia reversa NRRL 1564]|uniref:DUF572-domain-containing protein n=1 Tax=Coemansia reversa (strain ATCC 12441 / NRRL 1564) TaxID=763665 RepID=A0A2G5BJU1_COERN|nr:DUF572-domain-containing protein [Coemansia reversa NRRL 1564]|eukprot:PIA19273.1 DUF572-domain-containing protein [Coemansia reversa NRRL 1564]
MAERKAINKYYPPDWVPSKGSANAFVGQHPLRSRARKLDQGVLIVRFEMPFNIFCGGCNGVIATGQRFNAEKKQIGNYYSTSIWSFRMKCNMCSQWLEIHTNPKDATYDVVRGARKKAIPEEDILLNEEDIVDLSCNTNATKDSRIHKMELLQARKRRKAKTMEQLNILKGESEKQWKDPDSANAQLRKIFREGRKQREENKRQSDEIRSRTGIGLPILPASTEDSQHASFVQYGTSKDATSRKKVKNKVVGRPMFKTATASAASDLKTKIMHRQLGKSDPFASQYVGRFSSVATLGIKSRNKKPDTDDGLAELSRTYEGISSSSTDS